jgi:hypothetical protein
MHLTDFAVSQQVCTVRLKPVIVRSTHFTNSHRPNFVSRLDGIHILGSLVLEPSSSNKLAMKPSSSCLLNKENVYLLFLKRPRQAKMLQHEVSKTLQYRNIISDVEIEVSRKIGKAVRRAARNVRRASSGEVIFTLYGGISKAASV